MTTPDATEPDQTGISRRTAIVRGTALTAAVWAAPAITTVARATAGPGSPPPGGGGPPRTQRTITLKSSQQVTGTPDPLVEVFVGGSWVAARATNNGFYGPFAGTGFVNDSTCSNDTVFQFRALFVLPAAGAFDSPMLSGRAQADNDVAVRLNASPVLAAQPHTHTVGSFNGSSPAIFATTADFTPDVNYVYFDVHNVGCPFGLNFEATVTYNA